MGKKKGKSKSKSTSTVALPSWYDQTLQRINADSEAAYRTSSATPMPSLYTSPDQATTDSLGMRESMARAGSPVAREAGQLYSDTVNGKYLSPDSNPWLKEIADRASMESEGRINSAYAGAGRYGSGNYARAMADAQLGTRAQIYGANYDAERARQQSALGIADNMYDLSQADARTLGEVGQAREDDAYAQQEEAMRRYNEPWRLLGLRSDIAYGNPAQNTGTTVTKGRSKASSPFDWGGFINGMMP